MASPASGLPFMSQDLYGGGFNCTLPATFKDVSSLRQVPDNQEVFVHCSCDQSIIFELVEHQNVPNDKAAMYVCKSPLKPVSWIQMGLRNLLYGKERKGGLSSSTDTMCGRPYPYRHHFQDIAESNRSTSDGTKVHSVVSLPLNELALLDSSSAWLLHGSQLAAKFNEAAKTSVRIHLAVLRLPKYETDILISLNSPEEVSADDCTELIVSVSKSLKLLNPSLFG